MGDGKNEHQSMGVQGGSQMRRKEKKIEDPETIRGLLERSPVGRIATINRKGFPVIKPVNFFFWEEKIYIHSSTKGEKATDIRRGSPVCFEVDEPIAYVAAAGSPCSANYYFRSIVIKGKASFVRHPERKREILERLMKKYQPEGGYGDIPDPALKKTAVIEIFPQEMTGKQSLG
jgi:nitroimidazol reductase NimA-like FMN-containing flavoprotein (pyridoxamine 5'-phosphate oxidase superfamily)